MNRVMVGAALLVAMAMAAVIVLSDGAPRIGRSVESAPPATSDAAVSPATLIVHTRARPDADTPRAPDPNLAAAQQVGTTSKSLARLPPDDRAWVLAESAAALARGQIDQATLPAYVDQLASVREFAVLERSERYMNPEQLR